MPPKRTVRREPSETEQLALLCAEARLELANSGRALHDHIGPLLAGAGLLLSGSNADPAVQQALTALDQAMEHVRELSQRLNPSPVDRLGLEKALMRLASRDPRIHLFYEAAAGWPREAGLPFMRWPPPRSWRHCWRTLKKLKSASPARPASPSESPTTGARPVVPKP